MTHLMSGETGRAFRALVRRPAFAAATVGVLAELLNLIIRAAFEGRPHDIHNPMTSWRIAGRNA